MAPYAAAPFTGGASLAFAPAAAAAGQLIGQSAASAATGRLAESQNDTSRYAAQGGIFNAMQQAQFQRAQQELAQRQFAAQAPGLRLSNAARGSMMANAQDINVQHPRANVVHFAGSPRPSMLTPEARELGGLVSRQMLEQQQSGDQFSPMEMLTPPTLPDVPEAGFWERFGQYAGPALSMYGAIGGANQYQQAATGASTGNAVMDMTIEQQLQWRAIRDALARRNAAAFPTGQLTPQQQAARWAGRTNSPLME